MHTCHMGLELTKCRLSITAFLHRALRPTVTEVTEESLASAHSWDDVVFVGKFGPDDGYYSERYEALAAQYRDRFSFFFVTPLAGSGGDGDHGSSIRCWNREEEADGQPQVLTELWRVEALETFVTMCAQPLVPDLTTRKVEDRYGDQTGKSLVYYFAPTDSDKERYRSEIRPLARAFSYLLQLSLSILRERPDMLVGRPG